MKSLPDKANLRPAEVAAFLDLSLTTVYQLIQDGVIPCVKLCRHYRIPRERFLQVYEKNLSRNCATQV